MVFGVCGGMSSLARKIKRNQDRAATGELTEAQKRLPTGKVEGAPVRGTFISLPLLGWVSVRKDKVPQVQLVLALLRDNDVKGTLMMDIPVYKETGRAVAAALQRYGWKGDVWAEGSKGWPTGDEVNEDLVTTMLADVIGLRSTLIFPPSEEGTALAQDVEVTRSQGHFLMPPLPEPSEGDLDESILTRLLDLCEHPEVFFQDEAPLADI